VIAGRLRRRRISLPTGKPWEDFSVCGTKSCKINSLRENLRSMAGKFGSLPQAPAGNQQGIADNALPRRGRPPQGNEKQTHLSARQNPIKGIILTRKLAFCGALCRDFGEFRLVSPPLLIRLDNP
jgi:hypothetical protein